MLRAIVGARGERKAALAIMMAAQQQEQEKELNERMDVIVVAQGNDGVGGVEEAF